MHEVTRLFQTHGLVILFLAVWLENMGVPLPSFPFLLGAGLLAHSGHSSLLSAVLTAAAAALIADTVWYYLGRAVGRRILAWICFISLNPESCVNKTESAFLRHGLRSLLVAKYVPGLNTIAPPLCGLLHVPIARFLFYDFAGCIFWATPFIVAGFLFSKQLEALVGYLERFGNFALLVIALLVVAFIGYKLHERRKFYRHLRSVRIKPEELHQRMQSGEPVTVVDLRSPLAYSTDRFSIPGSVRISPEELERRASELPIGSELVLYCT
ncbi:MAG TPA: VTT domain-containing protein [Acidobacteriota bacterium]|jgi:membrane protein DedA with SNARE-associated domain